MFARADDPSAVKEMRIDDEFLKHDPNIDETFKSQAILPIPDQQIAIVQHGYQEESKVEDKSDGTFIKPHLLSKQLKHIDSVCEWSFLDTSEITKPDALSFDSSYKSEDDHSISNFSISDQSQTGDQER